MPTNASKCYFWQYDGGWGVQGGKGWKTCGENLSVPDNMLPCCLQDDMCLENLLCYNPNETTQAPGSTGYYVAGCTDKSYQSMYCNQNCITWYKGDVVQPAGENDWQCCGTVNQAQSGAASCAAPTNETFNAPSAAELIAKGAVTYPLTSTSSSPSSSGANLTISAGTINSSSLSAAAAAGMCMATVAAA